MRPDSANPRPAKQKRDFPGRRWLTIVLRSLHLVGVVLVGAALLGNAIDRQAAAGLMLATGVSLFALDLWANPAHLGEAAGAFIPLKLLVVLVMVLFPAQAAPLFWTLLIASSIVSHAPGNFRHRRIRG